MAIEVFNRYDHKYMLERKTSVAKPLWLTQMLSDIDIKRNRFSKYGTEYKKMITGMKLNEKQ